VTKASQAAAVPAYPANEDSRPDSSRLASAQRAVVGLTEIVEDSVELLGATLREEATRIPGLLIRPAAGILSAAVGAGFLTASAALYFRDLFGGWPWSFLALGAFYVLMGVVVWKSGRARQ